MGRKITDRRDARVSLDAWRASGLSLKGWANANGIDGRSLHCWRMNLERQEPDPARLVELVPTSRRVAARPEYTVRIDGIELVVGDDFREDTLERLLDVLTC